MRYALLVAAFVLAAAAPETAQPEAKLIAPDFFVVDPLEQRNAADDELGVCGNRWNNTGILWRPESRHPYFTLCHGGATSRDRQVVDDAVRRALRVGRTKYGVSRPTRQGEPIFVDVFVYPREAGRISQGSAFAGCCHSREGRTVVEIHAMTPSLSSDYPQGKGACYANVYEEGAATFMHEMMHVVQLAFDFDHSAVVLEGLAQYDAYAHGTPWAQEKGFWNNFEYAGRRETDNNFLYWQESLNPLIRSGLSTDDVYYGGLVLMKYLKEASPRGEAYHKDIMERGLPRLRHARLQRVRDWYTLLRLRHPGCRAGGDRFDPHF